MQKMQVVLACIIAISIQSATALAGQWYKGDLHSHSRYSDGDSSVADIMASVEAKGFDFFALTDHDTYMDGSPIHWSDSAYVSTDTVLLYGVEWTNDNGHANVWAISPFDYTALWSANRNDNPISAVKAAHQAGALFSINHPVKNAWEYPVVEGIDCVEIWNGPMAVNQNYKTPYDFWDHILMERRQVVGVGGSDNHHLKGIGAPFTGHGNPTTWVYAHAREADAILPGIARGNLSISYTVDAPRLEFMADKDGDTNFEALMGDTMVSDGDTVNFKIALVGGPAGDGGKYAVPSITLRHLNEKRLGILGFIWFTMALNYMDIDNLQFVTVIKDAQLFKAWLISGATDRIEFSDRVPSGSQAYYRVEIYRHPYVLGLNQLIYGKRLAVSNPIYIGY